MDWWRQINHKLTARLILLIVLFFLGYTTGNRHANNRSQKQIKRDLERFEDSIGKYTKENLKLRETIRKSNERALEEITTIDQRLENEINSIRSRINNDNELDRFVAEWHRFTDSIKSSH